MAVLLIAVALQAADRWVEFRSGPFEVVSSAGERPGRTRLNEFEQLRNGLEQVLGKAQFTTVWPIRILVVDSATPASSEMTLARDAYVGAVAAKGAPPASLLASCTRILLDSGKGWLPGDMERGVISLFSTLEVRGSGVYLGAPPPPEQRSREWAKLHLLAVKEEYYGKLRTLIYNLERGVEAGPAYRNSVGKSPEEIDSEAAEYLHAGNFEMIQLRRLPVNPDRDFVAKPVEPARAALVSADVLLADPSRSAEARAAYQSILKSSPTSAEALEGLGLLALREKQPEEARSLLARAIETGAAGARACLEYARVEPDRDKAFAALEKAARLNPRWAEPHFEMARREKDPALRVQLLAAAAKLDPRNAAYWRALAEAQESASQFADAAKSWAAAEIAAPTDEERRMLREMRRQAEVRRRDEAEAEKKRKAEEEQRELEALKQRSTASIQASLDKANREHPPVPPASGKVETWWDGPRPDGKFQGTLRQVDCLGKQARLIVEGTDRKVVRLLVSDPQKVFIAGGEKSLSCGPQKPLRRVRIEYLTKPDAKLGTVGEVAVIEFAE